MYIYLLHQPACRDVVHQQSLTSKCLCNMVLIIGFFTTKTCTDRVWLAIIKVQGHFFVFASWDFNFIASFLVSSTMMLRSNHFFQGGPGDQPCWMIRNKNLRTFGDLHLFRMTLVHPGMLMSLGRIQCWKISEACNVNHGYLPTYLKLLVTEFTDPSGDVRLDLLNKFQEEKCHLGLVTSNPEAWKRCRIRRVILLH